MTISDSTKPWIPASLSLVGSDASRAAVIPTGNGSICGGAGCIPGDAAPQLTRYPASSRQICATRKHTVNPMSSGRSVATVVHRALRVSV